MRSRGLLAGLLGAGLLAGLFVWREARGERAPRPAPSSAAAPTADALPAPTALEHAPLLQREAVAPPPASPRPGSVVALTPPELAPESSLGITVLDEEGELLSEVELRLEPELGPHEAGLPPALPTSPARRARTGDSGQCLVMELTPGPWRLRARHASGRARALSVFLAPGANSLALELSPRPSQLLVRVLRAGQPEAGAEVALTGLLLDPDGAGRRVGFDQPYSLGATDAEGRVRCAASGLQLGWVEARARDGALARVVVHQASTGSVAQEVRIELQTPATLVGRLIGIPPAELCEARVLLRVTTGNQPHYTTYARELAVPVDAEGAFRCEGLAAGRLGLGLADPRGAELVLPPLDFGGPLENSVQPLEVELVAGQTTTVELAVTRGAVLAGQVQDEDGAALAGVRVRATYAPATANFPDGYELEGVNVWRYDVPAEEAGDHPETHRTTVSAADGHWTLPGLFAGRWRLELALAGRAYVRETLVLAREERRELHHTLARAGAIQGVERGGGGYLGLARAGEDAPQAIVVLPNSGGFSFTGLLPGRYELARYHSSSGRARVPITSVTVEAGRTTWVDLTDLARAIVLRGRVVADGVPIEGARVHLYPRDSTTDARGEFRFDQDFEPGQLTFLVTTGAVTNAFELQPAGSPAAGYELELALGTDTLEVALEDSLGRPTGGKLVLEVENFQPRNGLVRLRSELALEADGRALLEHLSPGQFLLRATFDGLTMSRSLELPTGEPVVLRAPATASLEVRVLGPAGKPLARGVVVLAAPEGSELGLDPRRATARVTGEPLFFPRVPAGPLSVVLRSDARGWQVQTWALEELTLAPGERRVVTLRADPDAPAPR